MYQCTKTHVTQQQRYQGGAGLVVKNTSVLSEEPKFCSQHVLEALPEDPVSSFGGPSCIRVPFLAFSSGRSTALKASLRFVWDGGDWVQV